MTSKQTSAEPALQTRHLIKCTRAGFVPKALTVTQGDTVEFLGNTELNQHLHVLKEGVADNSLFGSHDFLIPNEDTHEGRVLTVSPHAEQTTYTILLKNTRNELEPMNGTITVNRGTNPTC